MVQVRPLLALWNLPADSFKPLVCHGHGRQITDSGIQVYAPTDSGPVRIWLWKIQNCWSKFLFGKILHIQLQIGGISSDKASFRVTVIALFSLNKSTYNLKIKVFCPTSPICQKSVFSRSHLEGLGNYTGHRSYPNSRTIMIFRLKTQYAQTSINQNNITFQRQKTV